MGKATSASAVLEQARLLAAQADQGEAEPERSGQQTCACV